MSRKMLILNFIYKFLFILRAASDGNSVKYIGGNKFEFNTNCDTNTNTNNSCKKHTTFHVSKYS